MVSEIVTPEERELRHDKLRGADAWGVVTSRDERRIILATMKETKCLTAVQAWRDQQKEGFLILLGTVGCGKTMAALSMLARYPGRYVTARRLERIFAANWGPDRVEQDKICECKTLVVDDVGTERALDAFSVTLLEVIDVRQGHGRYTLLTANLTRRQFFERYSDPRIGRRLQRALFVVDNGPDLTTAEDGGAE